MIRKRKRRVIHGYGVGGGPLLYGYGGYWGDRDEDDRDDLTMTSNLGEQFDGIGDGGMGDGGGGDA